MAGLNEVRLIGYLGASPELGETRSGTKVSNLSVATTTSYTNRSGERVEETEWHRVTAWGALAQACAAHLEKGSLVAVGGHLRTKKWDDNGTTRYATEIVAEWIQFLDRKRDDRQAERREDDRRRR